MDITNGSAGAGALNFINATLASGRTVHISTMTRVTAVSPKTAARWAKNGHELFKVSNGDLFIASGRSFLRLTSGATVLVGISAV